MVIEYPFSKSFKGFWALKEAIPIPKRSLLSLSFKLIWEINFSFKRLILKEASLIFCNGERALIKFSLSLKANFLRFNNSKFKLTKLFLKFFNKRFFW